VVLRTENLAVLYTRRDRVDQIVVRSGRYRDISSTTLAAK